MLVLTRKENESIIINGNIEIKLVDVVDGKARIGIIAPKNIKVYRKEVFEQIIAENMNAQNTPQDIEHLKAYLSEKKD